MFRLIFAGFLFWPTVALSITYYCPVSSKVWEKGAYSASQLQSGRFAVKIVDSGDRATLSRCSFTPIEGRVTCDDYEVDYIAQDNNIGVKKYYVFNSQFDIQLFANMFFVENNGRGNIGYGTCRVTRP